MSSYLKREISEWNTTDLSNWLIDNKYPGISELCQNNSLSGYDLFYITDDTLKNELGLNSFHERKVTMKLIKKLIYEHLKLNIINSNGDNVVLTLDNNPNTSLGELSEYIGNMFNINPKDILYKDTTKTEVLSPSIKIVELLILYPRLYKTLNVFNMKDYYQTNENENNYEINENMESKENTYNNMNNINNNSMREGRNSVNDSEYQKSNIKMNFNYKNELNENKYDIEDMNINNKRIIYNDERNIKNNKEIIYNDKYYNKNINENSQNENTDENYNEQKEMNKKMKYKKMNYEDNDEYIKPNQYEEKKAYSSTYRPRKNMNFNFLGVKPYQENYNKQFKNYEKNDNYYDN
jgi:hypothetical protein